MSIPPADVLAAAANDASAELSLDGTTRTLVALGDRVRVTLADIELVPVAMASPEARTQLLELHDEMAKVAKDLTTWVDAIELTFRRAAMDMGANEIPLADGVVRLDKPRGEWVVEAATLKRELLEYARNGGNLSIEQVEEAFKTTVEEKADNRRLSYFTDHNGDEVAAIIGRHRRFQEGNPLAAKLRVTRR